MTPDSDHERLHSLLTAPLTAVVPLSTAPLVLYGAGRKGRATLRLLREAGYHVAAMIDSTASMPCEGVPVLRLQDPEVASLARNGATAIVTIFNPGVDPLPVHHALATSGFGRIVGAVELCQLVSGTDAYWLATSDAMTPSVEEAGWLFDTLADKKSQETLVEAVGLRRTFCPTRLREPTTQDQYDPSGVPLLRSGVRLVDGGAFDGDTIAHLTAAGLQCDAIAAFEPDPANYATLGRYVAGRPPCKEISLWPCGLDRSTRQVRFHADGLASSGIADSGDIVIQTVSLDEALPCFGPTYVKLDIEGAEEAALQGMANTLRSFRPALAVCIYHKPADLWELPRLVDELLPDCQFFLRSHAWNGFDLVLYALPREMVTS